MLNNHRENIAMTSAPNVAEIVQFILKTLYRQEEIGSKHCNWI